MMVSNYKLHYLMRILTGYVALATCVSAYVGRPFSATFPFQLGVTIGFSPTTYTVSEGVGSVRVAVSLQNGILARDVVVTLQTLDGTAMGEYLREVHFVFWTLFAKQLLSHAPHDKYVGPITTMFKVSR